MFMVTDTFLFERKSQGREDSNWLVRVWGEGIQVSQCADGIVRCPMGHTQIVRFPKKKKKVDYRENV